MGCAMPRCKRAVLLAALLLSSVVLTAFAKDFWEAKPFTEWNEPETMKMLSESPWSRTLLVLGGTMAPAQAANRVTDLPSLSTTGAGRGSGIGQAGSGQGSGGDSVSLYVSWFSSERIRQAFGRLAQIRNNAPESQVKKFVEQPSEDYQICVAGPALEAFNSLSFSDFKPKTFLVSKKDKSKTLPLKSYVAPKDRTDGMAVFSFERQLNGKPAFGLEDQEVEFVAQGKKIVLKASFKLAKMMSGGNLDL
jgi:hypothetical protein